MTKRNTPKASGANDALFGGACLVAIIALGLCSAPAKAEDKSGPDVAFNAAAATDYVFRGVSQTESDPAVSAGVDVTQGLFYAGQPDGADYDYVELKAATSRAVGPATLGAAIYYSPDFFGASEDEATYAEINGAISPADKWTISAAVGRQWV